MRRLLGRWVAIVAVVAGVFVGASALPASADSASTSSTVPTTSASRGMHTNADWWV